MPSTNINPTWNVDYFLREPKEAKELIILLHGYQQMGETVLHFMESSFDERFVVISPNGPYPVPYKHRTGYRLGFAWYYFDPQTGIYSIDMSLAVEYVKALADTSPWAHLPKRIVGYSQGGYLAPFAALALENVKQVVGVNCRFRDEVLMDPLPFRLDAVHGAADAMVDPERAQKSHQAIIVRGSQGQFNLVPERGHQIDRHICAALADCLR